MDIAADVPSIPLGLYVFGVVTGSTPVPDQARACGPSSNWTPRTRTITVRSSDGLGPRPRRTGPRLSTLAGQIRDGVETVIYHAKQVPLLRGEGVRCRRFAKLLVSSFLNQSVTR